MHKSLGINGNDARLESDNKTSRTKGTHDSRALDDTSLVRLFYTSMTEL